MDNDISKKRADKIFNRKVYYDGDYIFRQGDEAYTAFFIEEGSAEALMEDDDHEVILGSLQKGDIFGEMALIDPAPRSASVRAVNQCTVIVISQTELEAKIELIDNKAMQSLFKLMIRRLRRSNEEQFIQSKSIKQYQTQLSNIVDGLASGVPEDNREKFREEVMPLLNSVEALVKKYAYKDEFVYGPEDKMTDDED